MSDSRVRGIRDSDGRLSVLGVVSGVFYSFYNLRRSRLLVSGHGGFVFISS